MAVLFASYDLCLPKPLLLFLWLLNRMSHFFSLLLVFLRLHPPPPSQAIRINLSSHTTDQHLSFPAPAPLPIVPTLIKSMLPVIDFARLAEDSPSTACVVCLGILAAGDEVRELGNCRHAFHKACIDNWIDMDGLSCPLCRLPLLPMKEEEEEKKGVLVKFFTRISWTLQIN